MYLVRFYGKYVIKAGGINISLGGVSRYVGLFGIYMHLRFVSWDHL